jgi:hypothetical protein
VAKFQSCRFQQARILKKPLISSLNLVLPATILSKEEILMILKPKKQQPQKTGSSNPLLQKI